MKISELTLHNFRSIKEARINLSDFTLLVGSNNSGKSNFLAALLTTYGKRQWVPDDFPVFECDDEESWIELHFQLTADEWDGLAEQYKVDGYEHLLRVRKFFKSKNWVKAGQANIYGYEADGLSENLFYGAKSFSASKLGDLIYIPALSTPADQTKLTGPSPLRDMLNFVLKRIVAESDAYDALGVAFQDFNKEAKADGGFLSQVASPLNKALSDWNIELDLDVDAIKPDDVTKSLIKHSFVDRMLGGKGFDLSRYGHGFQRSVIFELIRLAPAFKETKQMEKKEFSPNFDLLLFEEPEAFLHPTQQELMGASLKELSSQAGQQVIITTHSQVFCGKAANELADLCRISKQESVSKLLKPSIDETKALFEGNGALLSALEIFVADPKIPDDKKGKARKMIEKPPSKEVALLEEKFRYQIWMDSERSSMFFADKVLLVEGATERVLFNYLIENDWSDLRSEKIMFVDALGKYNFARFMSLFDAYGIPYGVMVDDDNGNHHHGAVNDLIKQIRGPYCLGSVQEFTPDIETFLGLKVPRVDRKPLEMLKSVSSGLIDQAKLEGLKVKFTEALAL